MVKLWHLTPGLEANVLTGGGSALQDLALSPDGRRLASVGAANFAVDLWDLSTRRRAQLNGHSKVVMYATFSPDGKILATGSHDQTAILWDAGEHKVLARLIGARALQPR